MLSLHIPQLPRNSQPGGLVAASRRLPGDLTLDDWRGGVAFNQGCHTGGGSDTCNLLQTKILSQIGEVAEFGPSIIHTPVFECDLSNLEVTRLAAEMHLDAIMGENIAATLHSGVDGGPSFLDATDITPTGGGGYEPSGFVATVGGLVESLAECNVFDVFIHIPVGYETYLLQDGLMTWDAGYGVYRIGPHTVVIDKYPNSGPTGSDPIAGDGSEVWVYASGPIYTEMGPAMVIEDRAPAANVHRVVAERLTLVVFDPCCVAAAVAQVC